MLLDSTRLLFDLQQVNQIVQNFAGCLEPAAIASCATQGLVEKFDCAFARIWIVEPDRTALRMVASSGLYPRTDGSFARVPMGSFKIGKIAQNCIPFLSNRLAEESWVKDREWAIATQICGFAGYPLVVGGEVIGVLAVFSREPLPAEFLEVLQLLCTSVAVTLKNAFLYQEQQLRSTSHHPSTPLNQGPLSEHLAAILQGARLTLVGTERSLSTTVTFAFLRVAEILRTLDCAYCRLTYAAQQVMLEAVISDPTPNVTTPNVTTPNVTEAIEVAFADLTLTLDCLGGSLHTQASHNPTIKELVVQVPYPPESAGQTVKICCDPPLVQWALTHLAYLAGLTVGSSLDKKVPVLTNQLDQVHQHETVIWVATDARSVPTGVRARIDLSASPDQLQQAAAAVLQGKTWGLAPETAMTLPPLSQREREVMKLLAQGLRDRDIASQLYISERTVKFHINNLLTKLNASTRVQALHQAIVQGWIDAHLSI